MSSSGNVIDEDAHFDEWEEEEEDMLSIKSLFSDQVFHQLDALIAYDHQQYGFDLRNAISVLGNDDPMQLIMLVNYIRTQVAQASLTSSSSSSSSSASSASLSDLVARLNQDIIQKEFLRDASYMKPFLPDDALLMAIQEICDISDDEEEARSAPAVPSLLTSGDATSAAVIDQLSAKVARYESMLSALVTEDTIPSQSNVSSESKGQHNDDYYFSGYGHISIHETMLRDAPRTSSYAESLLANASYVKDKVVLDVGCGTGILSLLAAKAGARKVIGVDLSNIVRKTKHIIERNQFADRISIVQGRLEEVELPLDDGEQVDIIISEWMGYGLYYENMLSSVLVARDKYLKPSGILMPSKCSLFIEALCVADREDDRVGWWHDVYSFDLSAVTDMFVDEAQVQLVGSEDIASDRPCFHTLEVQQAQDEDLDFDMPFQLVISREIPTLMGFVVSFDVDFEHPEFSKFVKLDTGAQSRPTHWKQTVLWLSEVHRTTIGALSTGSIVEGRIRYLRDASNARDYKIDVEWSVEPSRLNSGCNEAVAVTDTRFKQRFVLAS